MNKSINPYDLGEISINDDFQKVDINLFVRKATTGLKEKLVTSEISALGLRIEFVYSKTRYNGERLWFRCPNCKRRVGIIYKHKVESVIGCRRCFNLRYRQQRFKGMIESLV